MKDLRKKTVKKAKRLVVKVGSAVVASKDTDIFTRLANEMHSLKLAGKEAVLVSSGAVAMGMRRLDLAERPASIPERQAVAALGQGSLMARYDAAFSMVGEKAAQVLLTHDDLGNRKRFLNARNTLLTLLRMNIIPVINENDTVAVEEIKFGDNDELSALCTNLIEADLLLILTDIDGLFDKDPKADIDARLVPFVEDVEGLSLDSITGKTSTLGTGGMRSKCEAARKAAHFGVPTIVANGNSHGVISRILAGEDIGTFFLAKEDRLTSKKHWIAFSARPTGRVFVDTGAMEAVLSKGKSLLSSGVRDVDGSFDSGEVVHCVDLSGKEFARGVANYSSSEIMKIKGLKTTEIEKTLGYKVYDEVIHRDNLVVM